MYEHVLSGLIRRRREMECAFNEVCAQASLIHSDLEALDKVILMFSPSTELTGIPAFRFQPKPDWAASGEISRIILEALRGVTEPISTREILVIVHQKRGLEGEPTALHLRRLRKSLDRQREKGVLRSEWVDRELRWGIAKIA